MSGHTPGPWTAEHDEYAGYDCMWGGWRVRRAGPFVPGVVTVECGRGEVAHEQSEADARLIAAAPELLAACKALMSHPESKAPPSAIFDARAAVAKAEGRT